MRECWKNDKESRPSFQELKEEFDDLISHAKGYKYMPLSSLEAEACLDPAEELVIVETPPHDQLTACSDLQATSKSRSCH